MRLIYSQLSSPNAQLVHYLLVPEVGVEPTRPFGRRLLRPLHLPITPLGHLWGDLRDSNPKPSESQSEALPIELRPHRNTLRRKYLNVRLDHIKLDQHLQFSFLLSQQVLRNTCRYCHSYPTPKLINDNREDGERLSLTHSISRHRM